MTPGYANWTRRKFMLASAAGIAVAPLWANLSEPDPEAKADEQAKAGNKEDAVYDNPQCERCQVCTIFYSNCLALNNRICWREPAKMR
jgi:hypothetical protein